MPEAAEPLLVDLDVEAVEEPEPEPEPEVLLPEEPPLVEEALREAELTELLLPLELDPVPDAAATPPDGNAAPAAGIVARVDGEEAGPVAGTEAALG